MNNNAEHIDRFDAYLFGEMTAEERQDFEQALGENAALRSAFEAHRRLVSDLNDGAHYEEITDELRSIHDSLHAKPVRLFNNPKFLVPLGIAAVLVIGFLVVRPFITTDSTGASEELYAYETAADSTEEGYTEEVTPADAAVTEEAGLPADDLLQPVSSPVSGTAFLTGSEGYFVTTAGAVQGQDMVVLQNREGFAFEVAVKYMDDDLDVAVLQCHAIIALKFDPIPYSLSERTIHKGDVTLVPNDQDDLGLDSGLVIQSPGYQDQPGSFAITLNEKNVRAGTPVFSEDGGLIGMIRMKEGNPLSVLAVAAIQRALEKAGAQNKPGGTDVVIPDAKRYAPFIFEVHP